MGIDKICDINVIPIYQDEYVEENTMLTGYNNGELYIITSPKICNFYYKMYLHKLRKEKLEKINNLKIDE